MGDRVALLSVASAPEAQEDNEIYEEGFSSSSAVPLSVGQVSRDHSSRERFGTCRNCHEDAPRCDLIAPCHCSGSIKWVHRSCLDEWRAVSPNAASFSRCDVCNAEYKMELKTTGMDCSTCKFAFLISRDFLIFLVLLNGLTTLFSVLVWLIDGERLRDKLYEYVGVPEPPHLVTDWLAGWAVLLFFLGLFGIFASIMKLCNCLCCGEPTKPTYDSYNYGFGGYYFYMCWMPYPIDYGGHYHHHGWYGGCGNCGNCNCNCHGGNCSSGDVKGGGDGLIVLLLVVVLLIIIIGLVVGIFLIILFGMRVVGKHIHVLRTRERAGQWIVCDLADAECGIN